MVEGEPAPGSRLVSARGSHPSIASTQREREAPTAATVSGHRSCTQNRIGALVRFFMTMAGSPTVTGEGS